jgi:hypothetical protein
MHRTCPSALTLFPPYRPAAYYDDDNVIQTGWRAIAQRYLKTWFLPDIVSCVPITSNFFGYVVSGRV